MTAIRDPKVLIFIVAYNAERTISSVLKRIPVDRLPASTEVLVIDDSSQDATFRVAQANRDAVRGLRITVLYNPENQGYGGNQKLGYQYAIDHGFDLVALVHGDGQYAPEKLPELIAPIVDGDADAVFGSRMMERGAALRQGMPGYKYVGNKILTQYENFMLGMDLSEFHSGYRVYSVSALKRVPFKYNTNDFHFDTEIIIQFKLGGLRIREIPIPTFYGDEVCHVNGIKYAWDVFWTTLGSRVHAWGLFHQRKFDVPQSTVAYPAKLGYRSSHTLARDAVRAGARVLDLGCGPGYAAMELRKKWCHVTGVDREPPVQPAAFDEHLQYDLNKPDLPSELKADYDYVLMLDFLEHLDSPADFLALVRARLYRPGLRVIITMPNVGFFVVRLMLLMGQFNYAKQGILDAGRKRLFTFRSVLRLLREEGYVVKRVDGIPVPYPKIFGPTRMAMGLVRLNDALIKVWRRFFAYQIYLEAEPLPPLSRLLARSIEFGEQCAPEPPPIPSTPGS
jgi:glycosyltransferase involved in cell wall biosynthesis